MTTLTPPQQGSAPADETLESTSRSDAFAGTGTLFRFNLRRDRVRLPVWVLAVAFAAIATAVNIEQLYPDAADRASAAQTMDSPTTLAMVGPGHYLDDYNLGSMFAHQMSGLMAIVVALMNVLAVVRHTRAEEETGRAELVRSAAVGRHAPLTAALGVAVLASLALGALLALLLAALGMDGMGLRGSLLFGAGQALTGVVFAAVAAVTVQFTPHSRAASGLALGVLGLGYALRAAGDVGSGKLSWISPLGWVQRTYPYVDNDWWPLLLSGVVALALGVAGYALSSRRDLGAGLRPPRPGDATASPWLATPLGSALRLHVGLLLGFAAALLLLGLMYGSILGDVHDMLGDVAQMREAMERIGGTMEESFAAMMLTILAVIAAVYGVMAALRPRTEETAGRAEPLLATALSRDHWMGSHMVVAVFGGTVMLLMTGLGFGAAGALATSDGSLLWKIVGAALAYAPALWVTVGFTALLFGWLPKAVAVAWIMPIYAFIVRYLGDILKFPDWMDNLSPFGHVPRLPAEDVEWLPLALLTLLAAALIAAGAAGFRRRDLESK